MATAGKDAKLCRVVETVVQKIELSFIIITPLFKHSIESKLLFAMMPGFQKFHLKKKIARHLRRTKH